MTNTTATTANRTARWCGSSTSSPTACSGSGAHLELSGDELQVHANSEARFERVLATIRPLNPSVTVLRETREPARDVRAVQRLAARSAATPARFLDPAANPAICAALEG